MLLVLLSSAWGGCKRAPVREPQPTIRVLGVEREERCLSCHAQTTGIGAAHAPALVGCSPCHGGDPRAVAKGAAHLGMKLIPGALDSVMEGCGQVGCHPAEAARVLVSPMASAAGLVAIDKFAFGERATPEVRESDAISRLPAIAASPAEDHVRKLCGSCHLGSPKRERGDQGFFARGGGCTACHLGAPVAPVGKEEVASAKALAGNQHPAVTSDVSERRCEGCHARSGRISLSYRGLAEVEPALSSERLPDGRPALRTDSDVHARAGMTCIDCHAERDTMGDGSFHRYSEEAVEVRCRDCHGQQLNSGGAAADAVRVAEVLTRSWERRGLPSLRGRTPIVMARGTPLYRSDVETRSLRLAASGQLRPLPALAPAPHHALPGHERLSCQACHSVWAPRCTSCHTERVAEQRGFDHLSERETPGQWRELAGGNGLGPPALAVNGAGSIAAFVEGMTLTIRGVGTAELERSLWAPLDPHTTGRARTCVSCHFGEEASAARPIYPVLGETTRIGARLLAADERARIARVGRCLPCHQRYEDPIYRDFATSVERLSRRRSARSADAVKRCQLDPRLSHEPKIR